MDYFDEAQLGDSMELLELYQGALASLFDKIIADLQALNPAFNVERLREYRQALDCLLTMLALFPNDYEGTNVDILRIAIGFLNHAHDNTQADENLNQAIKEELALIYAVITSQ